ncbi:MAG: hypothetical protein JW818_11150 [Pirellulales bacterium]|nr:hypothetical protein [Pirellulales bacterium]
MIEPHCLGPDVDPKRIAPDVHVSGASYLTGSETTIGPGAKIRDSRIHNGQIDTGAVVANSILRAEGRPAQHRCDAAGRTVVAGAERPRVGERAVIRHATLLNTEVGPRSIVSNTWAENCRFGPDNFITRAKVTLVNTAARVRLDGPTEISEALLGHGTTIDRMGYYEGIFSNRFPQVRFDPATRRLQVVGTIDLPHVSRYGAHTINSTNSGKLLPQPDGVLRDFGPYGGLWSDPLLSHEQIELGPCCWVVPWTKVIGQSNAPHHSDEELVVDRLTTYLMPFAIAGVGGGSTQGLVMPGELSNGLGPKQRRGAWVFTYAPGAVIAMVARLHEALEESRKSVADTIVTEALHSALAMTEAMAAEHDVDLSLPRDQQPRGGWPPWIATTHALLTAHLKADLWRFEGGQPVGWRHEADRWTHPAFEKILALAPDALENQVDESSLFEGPDMAPAATVSMALPSAPDSSLSLWERVAAQPPGEGGMKHIPGSSVNEAVAPDLASTESASLADSASTHPHPRPLSQRERGGTGGPPEIDPTAQVDSSARIGPGCRIGPGTVVAAGASVWNSVLDGGHVDANAQVDRSILIKSRVGADTVVRSSWLDETSVGAESKVDAARLARCDLAARATVSPFADLNQVTSKYGMIASGPLISTDLGTNFMSMHAAGRCAHLVALPTPVELDGKTVLVPAVPMIGAGTQVLGTAESPVRMECCFIGSNSVIEAGACVGFGCFVTGRLEQGAYLLPLTLCTGTGPTGHRLGGVLGSLSSTILTHFINWAFQAVGPEMGPAVAELVRQLIARAIATVEAELARRVALASRQCRTGETPVPPSDAPLDGYTDAQLRAGLTLYQKALESGAWDIAMQGDRLRFISPKGHWEERDGTAFWRKQQ